MGKRGPKSKVRSYSIDEVLENSLKDIADFSSYLHDLVYFGYISLNEAETELEKITRSLEEFIDSQATVGPSRRGRPTSCINVLKMTFTVNAKKKRNLGLADLKYHLTNEIDGKSNSKGEKGTITIPKVSPTTLINWSRDFKAHSSKVAVIDRLGQHLLMVRAGKK